MVIRPAHPDDAWSVARVHVRAWQTGYRGLLPDDALDRMRPEDRAPHYTFGSPDPAVPFTQLAMAGDLVVGLVTVAPADPDGPVAPARAGKPGPVGEVCALYVDPDHWGQGVGRALLAEGRGHLVARGFTRAVLWVLAGNGRAERLYRADGWVADGTTRRAVVWGVEVDEVRFARALP